MTRDAFRPGARAPDMLRPRWIVLRALGLWFLSAFHALAFQIHGLVGTKGIDPADDYLRQVAEALPGLKRFWAVPTVFWAGAGDTALTVVVALGVVASLCLLLNLWPRVAVALCTALFLSCVSVLQDFNAYQSDGMLLEAGFAAIFLAPRGLRPGLGAADPPRRLALFVLQWEWFRIYFESGVVKLASGDPTWRNLTAMDRYYENGPLPSWPGWYVQHLPHWYHATTVLITFFVELLLVWALFLPRPARLVCFLGTTALQLGIIATANYAFLNWLVLSLGFLLLDDAVFGVLRSGLRPSLVLRSLRSLVLRSPSGLAGSALGSAALASRELASERSERALNPSEGASPSAEPASERSERSAEPARAKPERTTPKEWIVYAVLAWQLYATLDPILPFKTGPLAWPVEALEPLRVANTYGLFATMTPARYEIEFQGSRDGVAWTPYPFTRKPQDPTERPGIYAPYQPRFDWNLWFASLGSWRASPWVVVTQMRLVEGSPQVLALFRRDPFGGRPPAMVRTVLWQYWFTDAATKRRTGRWWERRLLGPFAGTVVRDSAGRATLVDAP